MSMTSPPLRKVSPLLSSKPLCFLPYPTLVQAAFLLTFPWLSLSLISCCDSYLPHHYFLHTLPEPVCYLLYHRPSIPYISWTIFCHASGYLPSLFLAVNLLSYPRPSSHLFLDCLTHTFPQAICRLTSPEVVPHPLSLHAFFLVICSSPSFRLPFPALLLKA